MQNLRDNSLESARKEAVHYFSRIGHPGTARYIAGCAADPLAIIEAKQWSIYYRGALSDEEIVEQAYIASLGRKGTYNDFFHALAIAEHASPGSLEERARSIIQRVRPAFETSGTIAMLRPKTSWPYIGPFKLAVYMLAAAGDHDEILRNIGMFPAYYDGSHDFYVAGIILGDPGLYDRHRLYFSRENSNT